MRVCFMWKMTEVLVNGISFPKEREAEGSSEAGETLYWGFWERHTGLNMKTSEGWISKLFLGTVGSEQSKHIQLRSNQTNSVSEPVTSRRITPSVLSLPLALGAPSSHEHICESQGPLRS